MKLRTGFVSNSSSSSFVLRKDFMGDEEIKDFQEMREKADMWDSIGETENFFFGVVDYSNDFCKWLEGKNFMGIQWG
jgi:hypothetical protein